MATVKTLSKGQIVIPVDIRKRYGIETGSRLQVMEYGGVIYIIPPSKHPVKDACGMLPSKPSLSGRLLKERRGEFK